MGLLDSEAVHVLAWIVSSVGALNWGLVAATDRGTGLIRGVLGLTEPASTVAFMIVAVAGAVSLYHLVLNYT